MIHNEICLSSEVASSGKPNQESGVRELSGLSDFDGFGRLDRFVILMDFDGFGRI